MKNNPFLSRNDFHTKRAGTNRLLLFYCMGVNESKGNELKMTIKTNHLATNSYIFGNDWLISIIFRL